MDVSDNEFGRDTATYWKKEPVNREIYLPLSIYPLSFTYAHNKHTSHTTKCNCQETNLWDGSVNLHSFLPRQLKLSVSQLNISSLYCS